MRQMNWNEIQCVHAGCPNNEKYSFSYVVDNAIRIGATGAFFNMLLNGITTAQFGWGFLAGVGAGSLYASSKLATQTLDSYFF